MLIGVLADTHDNLARTGLAIEQLRARGVAALLHAGDYVAPFALKLVVNSGIPFVGIFGNNDGERKGLSALSEDLFPGPHRLELEGRTIVMVHDPEISVGPPLIVNPGEVGGWLTGRCTGAIVELRTMTAQIIEFGMQERPIP